MLKNGVIEPLEQLPSDWHDGQELLVVHAGPALSPEALKDWAADFQVAATGMTDEMHAELMRAIEQVEIESKELARREMERSPFGES